LPAKGQNLGS